MNSVAPSAATSTSRISAAFIRTSRRTSTAPTSLCVPYSLFVTMSSGLKKLVEDNAASAERRPSKSRSVGSRPSENAQLRSLVISTAKSVVGMDGVVRRHQGALARVLLVPEDHVYLEAMKAATRNFSNQQKELREAGRREGLPFLIPPQDQAWAAVVLQ